MTHHGGLFSGIGCWNYAADVLGWETVFNCENNWFCQQVLKYYWKDAELFSDIKQTDFTKYANRIDVLSGSCPCQPFSVAGKRKGSSDDRHLWPEMLRAIREINPVWVCYENVPGITHVENGVVFEQVSSDLEAEGYETAPPLIIPACAKDAVHRRDRIWIVANRNGIGCIRQNIQRKQQRRTEIIRTSETNGYDANDNAGQHRQQTEQICTRRHALNHDDTDTADTAKQRLQRNGTSKQSLGLLHAERGTKQENWLEAATRLCSVDDEYAGRLDTTAISKSKWRTESLKAYGNAIYWPIAYEVFKAIENIPYET